MTISGFGPHRDFTAQFNPSGRTLVSGPSESGKTSVLEAITFCLWGRSHGGKFQAEAISEGMDKAMVEILLDSGRLIRRTVTEAGKQQRSITMGDDTQNFTSETAFAKALGDLGQDIEALQLVISPMAWVPMVEGNARAFRDLLTRVLPEGDIGAEVERLMAEKGHVLEEGESGLSEKEVMAKRGEARKARDEASGREQSVQERLNTLLATEPRAETFGAVEPGILDAADLWDAYDRAMGGGGGESAVRAWDERRAALGPEPAPDPALDAAPERQQAARRAASEALSAFQTAYAQHQTVLAQLQQLRAADPEVCPTCERSGWAGLSEQTTQIEQYRAGFAEALEKARIRREEAERSLEEAAAAAGRARDLQSRRALWSELRSALGPRPEPTASGEAPSVPVPEVPRPDPERVAAARSHLRESASFEGAHAQWQSNVDAARILAEREAERHQEATRIHDRLDDLLDAVRRAPSTVAARQALALGDLGPVSLEFGDNPAVKVHIDGRPWWLASRGRQVVSDMWLRGAIRRVMDREWLPIVVDNVQDVGGQPLPDLPGPVVLLVTNDSKGISVRRK